MTVETSEVCLYNLLCCSKYYSRIVSRSVLDMEWNRLKDHADVLHTLMAFASGDGCVFVAGGGERPWTVGVRRLTCRVAVGFSVDMS